MGMRHSETNMVGEPLPPVLVAFAVTFYTSAWLAFALYAVMESAFWWQVGLLSNVAGVLAALLAAASGILGRSFGIRSAQGALEVPRSVRLRKFALGFFALNLLTHYDRWVVGAEFVRPLHSGEVQVVLLPDAWLPLVLTGLGLLLTLLAGCVSQVASQENAAVEGPSTDKQPRRELRPSRNSLVHT